ncbi:HAD family hydrolase [Rossellomorea sp. NS-SX7]|uniref:HAD family hydrolase n=1 Tax=Rossellomorea sp. NS-SX7 TaxID=3463856 RepID=UPI0040587884
MKIDAVIFDMDGTLFQTDRILELSLDDAFERLRLNGLWEGKTPTSKYREIMGVPLPKVWETLLPCHSAEVRESVNEHFLERLIDNIQSGKGALYPHVKEVFTYLKEKQLKLFIASNGLPAYLESIVNHYGLDRWVDAAFSIEQVHSLNKSELVNMICDKYDVKRGAVVGDRLSDITAAKDNGLLAIGCRFDFSQEQELIQADAIIEDLMELVDLFLVVDDLNPSPACK